MFRQKVGLLMRIWSALDVELKTRVRKLVKELVPNHFTTFTIRESGPVYYTAED